MSFIVAIDGPAGSGKGTLAKELSESMRLINVDTGAMYRCVALKMLKENIELENEQGISEILDNIRIDLIKSEDKQLVKLNDIDVTEEIRGRKVTDIVSPVSSIKKIRIKLVELQRQMAIDRDIVMEGRDIGTYVFPNADVKIYLDASVETRAKRRYEQNIEKGIDVSYEEVLQSVILRDENDKNKEMGALIVAEDATVIDTTNLTIEEVRQKVENIINEARTRSSSKVVTEGKRKKKQKNVLRSIARTIVKAILGALVYIVYWPKKVGENNIPRNKPVIICPNHTSFLDPAVLVLTSKNRIYCMAKEELFKNPMLRFLAWAFEAFPVKRETGDIASMKTALKILKQNEILGIYPEGTRNGMAKGIKPKTGAVYLALATNAVIVPVGIQGNFKLFKKIKINYGKPLDFNQYKNQKNEKEVLEKITKEVMDEVVRLTEEEI